MQRKEARWCLWGRTPADRVRCSAARLRGFQKDLDMTDTQFATVLSVLYIGYTMMQIPSYVNPLGPPAAGTYRS
jgi:hypothetical protein